MKIATLVFTILFLTTLLLLHGCSDDDHVKEIYHEGEPVSGIEIFFPLGFYDAEPLMPKISPDGKKLLFTGPTSLPEWKGLWVMDLETQEKTLLHPNGRLGDWAPDSESIAFNIQSGIYKIKVDGTELFQLLPNEGYFEADWSPNYIIYFGGNEGAGIINQDGSGKLIIHEIGGQGDWHPFDNRLISLKEYSGNLKFPIYDFNQHEVTTVLSGASSKSNRFPKYSNMGNRITFFNSSGIYTMNADNSNVKRIIPSQLYGEKSKRNPKIYSAYPSWYPDGNHIIYEHFEITRSKRVIDATHVEGYIRFYRVNINDALTISNLSL